MPQPKTTNLGLNLSVPTSPDARGEWSQSMDENLQKIDDFAGTGGGGATPAGSDGSLQVKNGSALAANAPATLDLSGSVTAVALAITGDDNPVHDVVDINSTHGQLGIAVGVTDTDGAGDGNYGIGVTYTENDSTGGGFGAIGVNYLAALDGTNVSSDFAHAAEYRLIMAGTGTAAEGIGVYVKSPQSSGDGVTTLAGVEIENQAVGTFGTAVGLLVDDQGSANYSIKTGTGKVSLGDAVVLSGGSLLLNGAGSPAGVVSAPVGSLYLRTDGGTSTTLYVKESGGTGNTGWVAK